MLDERVRPLRLRLEREDQEEREAGLVPERSRAVERDPAKAEAWRRNVAEAGLSDWAQLVEGDAFETLAALDAVCPSTAASSSRWCSREGPWPVRRRRVSWAYHGKGVIRT